MTKRPLIPLVSLILSLFLIDSAKGSPIDIHLANVRDLFLQLREPAFSNVSHNYDVVRKMQQECDEAERHYVLDYKSTESRLLVDPTVQIHALLASAATLLVYEDLYEYHLEIACRRFRKLYGYDQGECQGALKGVLQIYQVKPGLSLQDLFSQRASEYEEYRNAGTRVEIVIHRSSSNFRLDEFRIKAVPPMDATPRTQLFAESLRLQFKDPVVKNWFIKYYVDQAQQRKINIEPTDYFEINPNDVEKSQWLNEIERDFRGKNPIPVLAIVPDGRYYIWRGQAVPNPEPNLVIDRKTQVVAPPQSRVNVRIQESGTGVVVESVQERGKFTLEELFRPKYEIVSAQLGTNRDGNVEGSAGIRLFNKISGSLALQSQYEISFKPGVRTREFPFDLATSTRTQSIETSSTREFQFDLGLVGKVDRVQGGIFHSFRRVSGTNFDNSAVLGQWFLQGSFVFSRGQVGVFTTLPSMDGKVVSRRPVPGFKTLFDEAVLDVIDFIGTNFQLKLPWKGYLEGNAGYLRMEGFKTRPGGVVRYVFCLADRRNGSGKGVEITAEGAVNEGFVGSQNSWRIGGGLRLIPGNYPLPEKFDDEVNSNPLPVEIPRLRYQIRHRLVRSGNDCPIADAGPDQTVDAGARVTLDGTGSKDPDGPSDKLRFQWTQTKGPKVNLEGANTPRPSFTAGDGEEYTFQLIVIDPLDCKSDPDTVTVVARATPKPEIRVFLATPNCSLKPGDKVTLQWVIVNATSAELNCPGIPVQSVDPKNGELPYAPPLLPATCILTAANARYTVARPLTITADLCPSDILTCKFDVIPREIFQGDGAQLEWECQNATEVRLEPGFGVVDNKKGTKPVNPSVTTRYVLTARNSQESKSFEVTLKVHPRPVIVDFKADKSQVPPGGDTVKLSWTVAQLLDGGCPISLTSTAGLDKTVSAQGPEARGVEEVFVDKKTTFTLIVRCQLSNGRRAEVPSEPVTVGVGTIQITCKAEPPKIVVGEKVVNLIFETNGARVQITEQNAGKTICDNCKSPVPVSPEKTRTYLFKAFSADEKTSATCETTVTVEPLKISCKGDPPEITSGGRSNLIFETNGARVQITEQDTGKTICDNCKSPVPVSPAKTRTYLFKAFSADEKTSATCEATIIVVPIGDFSANPNEITCSGSSELKYNVSNARTITITADDRTEDPRCQLSAPSGSCFVSPKKTTTYTLRAFDAAGAILFQGTARVTVRPRIDLFDRDPKEICLNGKSTLTWQTSCATTVDIALGVGTGLPANSSKDVSPIETTVYTITAFGADRTRSDPFSTQVVVLPFPRVLTTSTNAPNNTIRAGGTITIFYTTDAATSVNVEHQLLNGDCRNLAPYAPPGPGCTPPPLVRPGKYIFQVIAVSKCGKSDPTNVEVTVQP